MSLAAKLGFIVMSVLPVGATTILFDFSNPTGDLGVSKNYTVSGISVMATAFGPATPHLFGKADGLGEDGIGLTNDPGGSNELTHGSFIQLDFTNIPTNVPVTIKMGSTSGGETWTIFNTITGGSLSGATLLLTGTDNLTHIIPSVPKTFLDFTVPPNSAQWNVIVASVSFDQPVTGVPEPATLGLTAGALSFVFLLLGRRKLGLR